MKGIKAAAVMLTLSVFTTLLLAGSAYGYAVRSDTQKSVVNIINGMFTLSSLGTTPKTASYNLFAGIIPSSPPGGYNPVPSAPVPEPGTMLLLGISALAGAGYFVRRTRKV